MTMGCLGNSGVDAAVLKQLLKGKTEEQKKVIKYFVTKNGCLSIIGIGKNLSDDEYENMVFSKRDSMNFRAKALSKIGLDEDQVKEIPPAKLEGYSFKNAYAKQKSNGSWVSSSYEIAWIFFSSTQVYLYSYQFNMDDNNKTERTEEFFYKDVTSFSTLSVTEKAKGLGDKTFEVESQYFAMVVPGDKLTVPMGSVANAESIIQAMKQKLREKKM